MATAVPRCISWVGAWLGWWVGGREGWLVGCVCGGNGVGVRFGWWLESKLIGRSFGWLVGWLIGWLFRCLVGCVCVVSSAFCSLFNVCAPTGNANATAPALRAANERVQTASSCKSADIPRAATGSGTNGQRLREKACSCVYIGATGGKGDARCSIYRTPTTPSRLNPKGYGAEERNQWVGWWVIE